MLHGRENGATMTAKWAARIPAEGLRIGQVHRCEFGGAILTPVLYGIPHPFLVGKAFCQRYKPQPNGLYFVKKLVESYQNRAL